MAAEYRIAIKYPMRTSWLSAIGTIAGIAVTPLGLAAAGTERGFDFDPVDHYGSRALTGILVLGILIILYSMIRYRGRTGSVVPWALLTVGLVLIPGVVFSFGTVLVLERAEKNEFCLSCHLAMKGHVDDMVNPNSTSLAALHFKNRYISSDQCYECHTSYGVNGTLEAKMSGTVDLYKYYTRTFHHPIKMREAYPNGDCLKCHAQAVKWLAQHGDFKADLFSGKTKCLDCHAAMNPPHTVTE